MGVLSVLLLSVFGISAILLVVIILMQDEQSDGLGGIFGGGSSNQVGNRQGNILTKATTILGVIFLVVAFGVAWLNHNDMGGIVKAATANSKKEAVKVVEWWAAEPSAQPAGSTVSADPANASPSPLPSASTSPSVSPAPGNN